MPIQVVNIPSPDGQIDAWLHTPEGPGPWPGVILHTDIRGVRETFQRKAAALADEGYAVLLPNLYYRVAQVPVADPRLSFQDEGGRKVFGALRASLSAEGLRSDHRALLGWLQAQPQVRTGQVALVGYCMSGAIAVHAAADFPERIAVAASFHGGNLVTDSHDSPHLRAHELKAKLHFGHAKDDPSIPLEAIERLDQALLAAEVTFSSTRHEARHGFAVADSTTYDEAAERQHWRDLLALLRSGLPA
ncbi:dienelactone hydrolase family protein [Stutzerimonas kirkiae]|uniref:dienelactone hydrolase family protein n=1 Tax=Stutzerimonas kirkiae TaxID=2211392 RepID=UPI0010385B11|nr:dienelactone hydrolase family protein [Stutzerimonas kirkiae]TBV14288.1 dienelactone hydrolase [Stutzerimonas kirkiae]